MEPRVEIKEHMRGGKGHVIMKHLWAKRIKWEVPYLCGNHFGAGL